VIDRVEGTDPVEGSRLVLLKRAFQDFRRIRLESLLGSYSQDRGIWRVDAEDHDGRFCQPFVAKADSRQRIGDEIAATVDFVLERVPFPHWAPIRPERCVEGATDGLLVSMFVEQAMRFDHLLSRGPVGRMVSGLFAGPLRGWRSARRLEQIELGKHYEKDGILPKGKRAAGLAAVFPQARVKASGVPDPDSLLRQVTDLKRQPVMTCHVHGDLHSRNIYVRRGVLDLVLIDFASATSPSPVSLDPATLEVSIAVGDVAGLRALSDTEFAVLYSRPLLPPKWLKWLRWWDVRFDAIERLRTQAQRDGATTEDYEAAVVCLLLRFAALNPGHRSSPLAYLSAARLLEARDKN